METKIGIIKTITEAQTKKGSIYYRFEMQDGMKVNNFDCTVDDHKIGDTVKMEGEQSGQYWNLKRMSPSDGNVPVEKVVMACADDFRKPDNNACIVRESAIRSAVMLIEAIQPVLTDKEASVLSWQEIASDMEAWILR